MVGEEASGKSLSQQTSEALQALSCGWRNAGGGAVVSGHAGHHVFQQYLEDASRSGIAKEAAGIPAKHSQIFDNLLSTKMTMAQMAQRRSQEITNAISGITYSMHLRVSINQLLGY